MKRLIQKKSFGLKILLPTLQMTWTYNIYHYYGPNFWNGIEFEILPSGGQDFHWPFLAVWDCFETAINHSLLVVEFKTKSHFKIWSINMEYIVRSGHLEGLKYHFWAKTFFQNYLLHTVVNKTSEGMCDLKTCLKMAILKIFLMNLTQGMGIRTKNMHF